MNNVDENYLCLITILKNIYPGYNIKLHQMEFRECTVTSLLPLLTNPL